MPICDCGAVLAKSSLSKHKKSKKHKNYKRYEYPDLLVRRDSGTLFYPHPFYIHRFCPGLPIAQKQGDGEVVILCPKGGWYYHPENSRPNLDDDSVEEIADKIIKEWDTCGEGLPEYTVKRLGGAITYTYPKLADYRQDIINFLQD